MKQSDRKKKRAGADGFDEYYRNLYGARWERLKAALLDEGDPRELRLSPECEPYFLDSASIRAALSLPLSSARAILDVCAAPGGKTLVLASRMENGASLLSNERSAERTARLKKVCDACLPSGIRPRVHVTSKDGARLCLSKENEAHFDAILLDAPCSSERHVLSDEKYLSEWSPSRVRSLSAAQWALLSSSWRMLRPGGFLLYSTCALSCDENDGAVSRLLKKFPDAVLEEPAVFGNLPPFAGANLPECEKTEFGAHILPDAAHGAGPIYFSLVRKMESAGGI